MRVCQDRPVPQRGGSQVEPTCRPNLQAATFKVCKNTSLGGTLRDGCFCPSVYTEPWANSPLRTVCLFAAVLLNPPSEVPLATRASLSRVCPPLVEAVNSRHQTCAQALSRETPVTVSRVEGECD